MTSVFFWQDICIYYSSVSQTWYTSTLWHQCFSDMKSTLMTSAYFIWNLHWWHQCFTDMISTLMTSVFFTWYQMKTISSTDGWRIRRTHSIIGLWHFCSCIKNDDNTTIVHFVLLSSKKWLYMYYLFVTYHE